MLRSNTSTEMKTSFITKQNEFQYISPSFANFTLLLHDLYCNP